MPSVMSVARTMRAPLKMPGNTSTLLIWLGKSLRPVPMTAAPPLRASSGMISGTGLAMGNTMPQRMVRTISAVTRPGRDTPMKASAPLRASARVPCSCARLEMWEISSWPGLSPGSPAQMTPLMSHITTLPKPIRMSSFPMAMPAAPAPLMTILTLPISFPVTLMALSRAAATTMAVPC